jgi:hypothetical protein
MRGETMSGPVTNLPAFEFWATDTRDILWRIRRDDSGTYVDRWSPSAGWHPSPSGGDWYLRMRGIGSPDDRDQITEDEAIRLMATLRRDPLAPDAPPTA